jgi:hypothetical protein
MGIGHWGVSVGDWSVGVGHSWGGDNCVLDNWGLDDGFLDSMGDDWLDDVMAVVDDGQALVGNSGWDRFHNVANMFDRWCFDDRLVEFNFWLDGQDVGWGEGHVAGGSSSDGKESRQHHQFEHFKWIVFF